MRYAAGRDSSRRYIHTRTLCIRIHRSHQRPCYLTCTLKGTGPLHERFRVGLFSPILMYSAKPCRMYVKCIRFALAPRPKLLYRIARLNESAPTARNHLYRLCGTFADADRTLKRGTWAGKSRELFTTESLKYKTKICRSNQVCLGRSI